MMTPEQIGAAAARLEADLAELARRMDQTSRRIEALARRDRQAAAARRQRQAAREKARQDAARRQSFASQALGTVAAGVAGMAISIFSDTRPKY